MLSVEKIIVTSALPYANGPIHLGHLAGAYLPADIFVRYHRLKGNNVIYICGSDEHGVPIMLRARSENKSPQAVVDYFHEKNKESFKAFGMSFDYYGRTSSPIHHQTSQDMFRELANKGVFVLKTDEQLFDPEANLFLADRFIRGTCPSCSYDDAYGDQCEKCGVSLSPSDLINPRSAITNAKPVMKESTHWYLPLAGAQADLEAWIELHPEWKSNVIGQIRSWFNDGLKDRAVTRDLDWGVPVPQDIAAKMNVDASGKVLYVWFDAPIGYISATKEWAIEKGQPELWKEYWQQKETRLIHFIGKDNIVFHCLIFPAMLKAHGDYILPDNVPANEFLNLEGDKLSTSRNYAVWLDEYLKDFEPDALRYCLASILPETRDTDFSWKDFQSRYNNELADILGNFVNRTLTFLHKNFEGKVPGRNELDVLDQELILRLAESPTRVGNYIDTYQIRQAVREIMDLARFANKYFNDKTPWKSIKSDLPACETTISLCVETIRTLSYLLDPVIPFTAQKIREMLNLKEDKFTNVWDQAGVLYFKAGQPIRKPDILFQKIEDDIIEKEIAKLKAETGPAMAAEEATALISIDEFKKIDLRVAEILKAEPVPKTDRLLKLQIKVGKESRQIVAGIAGQYKPESIIGKKVVIVANLEPVKIRGEESKGMLLAAKADGQLTLLTTVEDIESGAGIS
ncbi:MAG: methionine--tRNA ligase [Calditrichales bacterium]|nr:MAG: methionine--tRNA ligase [Calditrichales bacterium]